MARLAAEGRCHAVLGRARRLSRHALRSADGGEAMRAWLVWHTRTGGARRACYAELLRWWSTDGHLPGVLPDCVKAPPGLRRSPRAVKAPLLGAPAAPRSHAPG